MTAMPYLAEWALRSSLLFLAEWALRSSVLIASGALLLWALRVKDASIRWAAWTAMMCASLAIPALTAALPRLPLVVMRAAPARVEAPLEAPLEPPPPVQEPTFEPGRALPRPDAKVVRPVTVVSKPFDWARAAVTVYVLVAFALLLRLALGLALSLRLLRRSRATGETTEGIEIRESDGVAAPVALGIVRPAIVLPSDWREWDAAKLEAVLAHERSHVRRHDPAVQLLSAIHRALLWYSPLSWFLHRRIVRTAEDASDDAALAVSQDRAFYAEVLLDFMQRGVRGASWQAVPMARYGRADKRIHRILDCTNLSRGVTRWSVAAILLAGLPLAGVVSAAHPQSAPPAPIKVSSFSDAKIGERQTRAQTANPDDSSASKDSWPIPPVKALGKEVETPYTQRLSEEVPYKDTVKASSKEMGTPYTKWLSEEVPYIITDAERTAFRKLASDEEREGFIANFWERRNPNPGSSRNEFKEEYYRRIAYANRHYASGIPGWRTDRGRIYIMFGPPDEIESHPKGGPYKHPGSEGGGETLTFPFELWRYRYIAGIGTNIVLDFVDTQRDGEYHLTMEPGEKDKLLNHAQVTVERHRAEPREVKSEVYILGAVQKPGAYPLPQGGKLTIAQALAQAGGFDQTAKRPAGVSIIRKRQNGTRQEISVYLNQVLEGKDVGLQLGAGDILFVPGGKQGPLGVRIYDPPINNPPRGSPYYDPAAGHNPESSRAQMEHVRPFVMEQVDFVVLDRSLEKITSRNIVSRRRDGAYSNLATLYGPAGGRNEVRNTIIFPNGLKIMTNEEIRARSTTMEAANQLPDFMTVTMMTNPPASCVEQGETLDGEEHMLGQRTARIITYYADSLTRWVDWELPEFNCMRVQASIQKRSATTSQDWKTVQGERTLTFAERDPEPSVFTDWTGYQEMKPSDLVAAYLVFKGSIPQEAHKIAVQDTVREDKQYAEWHPK